MISRGKSLPAARLIRAMGLWSIACVVSAGVIVALAVFVFDTFNTAFSILCGIGIVAALNLINVVLFAVIVRWVPHAQGAAFVGSYVFKLVLLVAIFIPLRNDALMNLDLRILVVAFAIAEVVALIVYLVVAQRHTVAEE